MKLPTMRELIAEYGVHAGTTIVCSCCGRYMLYKITYPDGTILLVCSDCDTER